MDTKSPPSPLEKNSENDTKFEAFSMNFFGTQFSGYFQFWGLDYNTTTVTEVFFKLAPLSLTATFIL